MSFRGDVAEEWFARSASAAPSAPTTTRSEWERRVQRALRIAEADIATRGAGFGWLPLPKLSEVFQPRPPAAGGESAAPLLGAMTFGSVVPAPEGRPRFPGWELVDSGPLAWAYATFVVRNPWPPEVRPQVHAWCRGRIHARYGEAATADFDRYLSLEARIAAVRQAFQWSQDLATDAVRLADVLPSFRANLVRVRRTAGLALISMSDAQRVLDAFSGPEAHTWPSSADRFKVAQSVDEPLPPRLGIRIRELLAHPGDALLTRATNALRQEYGPHRLEVVEAQYESAPAGSGVVGRIRMHAVVLIGPVEFGDVELRFDLDTAGTVTAAVDPQTSEFVPEYLVRGGTGRGSFLDMVRHFVRGAGANVLRVKAAADSNGVNPLHSRGLLVQAGFEPVENAPEWLSELCEAIPPAAPPTTSRLDRRLTREQVLRVMEQVRVTPPDEYENQCGVWHLPLSTTNASTADVMVTVRVYLLEAERLGFDFDGLVVSAAVASDAFHQAGVQGPRLLYDSESSQTVPVYRTRVTIHEYVPGSAVLPDEGWERTTEDVSRELMRLHNTPVDQHTSQIRWEHEQQIRLRQLELDDTDRRLDALTDGAPLFATWMPLVEPPPRERMGFTHGNPLRRKMRRGTDGRVGFTDAKSAQYAPIAWDWARYYLGNDWLDDDGRRTVDREIRTILRRGYGDDIGDELVADFDRYVLLEARKSLVGDAYRLPRKIAAGIVTVDDVLPDFYRHVVRVRRATHRRPLSLQEVRELLIEWSQRELEPDAPEATTTPASAAPAQTSSAGVPRQWVRQLFAAAMHPAADAQVAAARAVLAVAQHWDGPLRLEPTAVRWLTHEDEPAGDTVAQLIVMATIMDGRREYGDMYIYFYLHRDGRITANDVGTYPDMNLDRLVLDFARGAGADHIQMMVRDRRAAARAGFDWNRKHAGEMAGIRETLLDAVDAIEHSGSAVPAGIAEVGRQLRSGVLPTPRELLDSGMEEAGISLSDIAAPWYWGTDLAAAWDAEDVNWSEPENLPVARRADTAPSRASMLVDIRRDGSGSLDSRLAARLILRAALRSPDRHGYSTQVWFDRDGQGNRIVVHRALPSATLDKDLTRNPGRNGQDGRWFHWLAFDVPDAVELAAGVINVPETVYQWGEYKVEMYAEGRTSGPDDPDWEAVLDQKFAVKRRLLDVRLPAHLRVRPVTEHLHLYLDYQRRNYHSRAAWLDQLFRLAPHQAWSPETDDQAWPPSLNHNDMTLDNVRVADDGTLTLIDWDNAAITHPLWDYVTMLWTNRPPEIAEAVENKIRSEVRDRFGPRGEAELERLLTMACLDSLYADSRNFVKQIADDPDKVDTLVGRFYTDYRRLCRLRGWEPESQEVVRTLITTAANQLRAGWGDEPLPDTPDVQPSRPPATSTVNPGSVLPTAETSGDEELLAVVHGLLDREYGPRGYMVVPTGARFTTDTGNRRLTVSASIVVDDDDRGIDEPGDMRLHLQRSENGLITVTFDHLVVDEAFAGGQFVQHFVPRLRDQVGAGGRIVVPIHGPTGFRVAAHQGLRLDSDPEHLAESRESTAHLLNTDPDQIVADPMLDRFDRPAEARPTFAEMAEYFEQLPHGWPQNRRWWGVLDGAPMDTAAAGDAVLAGSVPEATSPRPMARMTQHDAETEDPALTEPQIELLTTLVRDRAAFAGNHHGVWVIVLPNDRKVVMRVSTATPNPNFDPRIGLVFGEPAAVALCQLAGVRVPQLYYGGAQDTYPERYMIHEFLDGRHPSPEDPWQVTAEGLFTVLDRLHAMHADRWDDIESEHSLPNTRAEWERRFAREVARIRLEFDADDRLHGDLGMPGLHEVFAVRPESHGDVRLGALHGDPTFGNIIRLGPDGEQVALIDLELAQPGSPVWDYVAFAARNPWPTPAVRNEVLDWCRQRLRRYYGDAAAADFDRYRVLEAWKSAAGDSFRLPLLVARDPAFLDNAAEALHRNLTIVFEAAGRQAPSLARARDLLWRWSRRLVRLPDPQQAPSEPLADMPEPEAPGLPRVSIRELLRMGSNHAQADQALRDAVATMKRGDGPARLEPVAAEFEPLGESDNDIVSRLRMRTVLMDGPREYGEVLVRFDFDRAGRVIACPEATTADLDRLAGDYGGPYLLGPAEDLARRMGADIVELEVSGTEGARAARHGFGWATAPGKFAESTASVQAAMRATGGHVPDRLPDTPQQVRQQAGAGALFARWWASKDLTDPAAPSTPIEYRAAARQRPREDLLPDITEAVEEGGMELEQAAKLVVLTAMSPADVVGHYTQVWCVTDRDGSPVKVRRVVAKPGDKDLAANPTHPKLLDGDRNFHLIDLDEERAEELARQAGVDVPKTVARWGAHSFREMGEGRIAATDDPDWRQTLRGLFRQLRLLQTVELPDDLAVRSLAEHEGLYHSMQRIKHEQSHPFLNMMRIPMPHQIWVPGDTTWKAGLSHGNATLRNLWVRPDGEVRLDNWNLAGIRHQLWDYVTLFWNPWPLTAVDEVVRMVEEEIRDQFGASGIEEFRRLRAMACLDSLYSDSVDFVNKIRIDPRKAQALTHRFYADYLWLWNYAEAAGVWPSRGAHPLSYEQVDALMRNAADPTMPWLDLDADFDNARSARQTSTAPGPDLSAVPAIPDLLAEYPPEHELLSRLSGLQQHYGLDLELVLTRVEYLRTGPRQVVSGVRIRGVFITHRGGPAEAGDLDLSIEIDEDGRLTARFDELWIEPWHGRTGCGRDVVPALRGYLRRSGVESVTVTVHGRRGAKAAIGHGVNWDYRPDPQRLTEYMRALRERISAHLAVTQDPAVTSALRQILVELNSPPGGRYPTPADIARHMPPGVDVAPFFEGIRWQGVTAP
ncbi:hypothetical protein AB0J47_35765 [Nocardia sp. NPDC049737]|uniref:hypothetical protein n=1 Tax=Nocardia sp. NPDC049737 TaxID=3154358 RepID=UPI0034162BBA